MKRPALRGDVIWAGVTCDARLLSCSFFEPSALPLPWTFCRSPVRQNRALPRVESVTWRLQPPGVLLCCSRNFEGQNRSPRQRRTNASAPRFSFLGVYGCHPGRRSATNRLTTRNRGFTVLGCRSNRDGQLLAEKILPKKSVVDFSVFETFWEHCLIGRVLLSDYSVVKFSVLRF